MDHKPVSGSHVLLKKLLLSRSITDDTRYLGVLSEICIHVHIDALRNLSICFFSGKFGIGIGMPTGLGIVVGLRFNTCVYCTGESYKSQVTWWLEED